MPTLARIVEWENAAGSEYDELRDICTPGLHRFVTTTELVLQAFSRESVSSAGSSLRHLGFVRDGPFRLSGRGLGHYLPC